MSAHALLEAALPFAGVHPGAVALIYAANFLGFFVRGAFGFGSNLPIVLLTTWVLGPHHAVVLTVLTALVANATLLPQGLRSADRAVARPLMLGMLAGTALGTWVFARLPGDWLMVAMGALIVVLLGLEGLDLLARVARRVDLRAPRLNLALATLSAGAGTVSGGGGMYLLVLYLRMACRDAVSLRGTNLLLSALFQLERAVFAALAGFVSLRWLAEAAVLLPVVFLGTWAGTRYFERSSAARYQAGLRAVLLLAAAALLTRGVLRLT